MFLTRLAVHRPVATLMAGLIVVLLGVVAVRRLAVDLMPDITFPMVNVYAVYEGAAPDEIETLITRPLEQALSSVAGVERLASNSAEGSSTVRVQLQWGTEIDAAIADMRQAINKIRSRLPREMDEPYVRKYDVADSPIMYIGLSSDLPIVELTQLAERHIVPRLERVPGVAGVRLRGAVRREIQVDLDRNELAARDISVNEVVAALGRDNQIDRAGDVAEGNMNLLVRSHGQFQTLDEIANTVIRSRDGAVVRIADLGRVVDGEERRTELARTNGKPGMMVYIMKQSGANTIQVSDRVHRAVADLNAQLAAARLIIRTDKSNFIRQAIANVRKSVWYGMGLAVLVLLFFLQSLRSTLVISVSIPLAVLATFVLMYFKGFTLNIVSFGGLALGIGLLVDNSIVVLESIFRQRQLGVDVREAAILGTQEVASAVTASTVTTMIVFLPMLFVDGVTGVMLNRLAWVVSMSLVCSLVASFTITPMLTTFGRPQNPASPQNPAKAHARWSSWLMGISGGTIAAVERSYAATLTFCLRHRTAVSLALVMMVSATLGLIPFVGTEFMPKADEGYVRVDTQMAPGVQLAVLDRQTRLIEGTILNEVPEVQTTATFVGDEPRDGDSWHESRFRIQLVPRTHRDRGIAEITSDLKQRLPAVAGMKINVRASNTMMAFRMISGDGGDMEVEIRGYNPREAKKLTAQVVDVMRRVPGLSNVDVEREDTRPVMSARIDRVKAGMLGISIGDITQTIETTIRGTEATVFREDGDEHIVLVRLSESDRNQQSDVGYVGVPTPTGQIIPLRQLVYFDHHADSLSITRLDQQRVAVVSADVTGHDLGRVVADLQQRLNGLALPKGFSVNVAGDWEEQQRSFTDLRYGFVLAIALMYMVMASQFESFREPLIILITVPLGAVGVILMFIATGTTLNVQSFIGLVMLAGIVVNNAIVLVDYAGQLIRDGAAESARQAISQAATRRLRPILMTTITTVLAMLPVAIGAGEGGELQAPLARVVIGGLLSGTLITLVAIPLILDAVYGQKS